MKNILFLTALWCLSLGAAAQQIEENAIPDQYIVHLHGGIDANDFFGSYPEAKILKCLSPHMNIWLIHSDSITLLSILKVNPSVIAAQYNHENLKRRSLVPNDAYFGDQWNMLNLAHPGADISATQAWGLDHNAVTRTGDSIVIAVIDGTFDIYHQDINFFVNKNEIPNNGRDDDGNGYIDDYHGWNVFMNNDSVYDLSDIHGTHVAGIAAAIGNNNIGVAGVCWGAKILAIDGSSTFESDVVSAYDYVINMRRLYDQTNGVKGAFIVASNSSFGVDRGQPADYPIWCAMYDSMGACGILSACATANNYYNIDAVGDMPTTCPSKWMIAVTNTTSSDMLNTTAAFGPVNVDIGAPGTGIESTYPGNSYGGLSGTSMATPHVAGAVAAMMAYACPRFVQDYFSYPDSMALILRDYMFASVDPLSTLGSVTTTGGRLDLYHALLAEDAYNCNNCNYNLNLLQQNLVCYGDSDAGILVSPGNSNGRYHYIWSTNDTTSHLTGLKAGFYQLTVTDSSGCQRSAAVFVTQPSRIAVTNVTVVPFVGSSHGNVIITASAGNDTLYYAMDTGSFQSNDIFVIDTPGLHHFRIRNSHGCEVDTTIGVYYTGIKEETDISYLRLSPNPTSGLAELLIRSDKDFAAMIALTDLTGRVIQEQPIQISDGIQRKLIDLSPMANGIYILSIVNEGQAISSIKLSVIK